MRSISGKDLSRILELNGCNGPLVQTESRILGMHITPVAPTYCGGYPAVACDFFSHDGGHRDGLLN